MDANFNCGCFNWLYSVKSPIFASVNNYPHFFPLLQIIVSVWSKKSKYEKQKVFLFLQNVQPSEFKLFLCRFFWDDPGYCLKGLGPLIRKAKKLHNNFCNLLSCSRNTDHVFSSHSRRSGDFHFLLTENIQSPGSLLNWVTSFFTYILSSEN